MNGFNAAPTLQPNQSPRPDSRLDRVALQQVIGEAAARTIVSGGEGTVGPALGEPFGTSADNENTMYQLAAAANQAAATGDNTTAKHLNDLTANNGLPLTNQRQPR